MYVLIVIGNGIDCYSQLLLFVWHSLCCRHPFLHSSQFSCMFLRFSFWGRSNGSPVGICSLPCFISSLHPFILSNSKTSSWVILYASSSVLSQGTSSLLMLKLFPISFIHSLILSLVYLLLAFHIIGSFMDYHDRYDDYSDTAVSFFLLVPLIIPYIIRFLQCLRRYRDTKYGSFLLLFII